MVAFCIVVVISHLTAFLNVPRKNVQGEKKKTTTQTRRRFEGESGIGASQS